jgi:hypothetical protein
MTTVSNAGFYHSVADILAQQYAAANRKTRSSEETILDGISQTDPNKADTLKKQLDDANQVIAQLRAGKSNARQSRKADAAEKIKRIMEQIKMLKLMGGDPKKILRQIAQLVRELGSAAREYAAASAGSASSQDSAAPAGTATNTSGDNTAMSNVANSDSADSGTAATMTVSAAAVSSEPAATGEKEEKDARALPDAASTAPTSMALDKGMQQYQETQRQKINDDVQRITSEIKQKSSSADADRQFAEAVRTLAALLKALARQQAQRLHKAGDHTADHELNQINQVLVEAEKSVSGTVAPIMTATTTIITA